MQVTESGSALVELALTTSLLGVPLFLATVHFSILLIDSMVIANAAHAGAEYGMASGTYASDTSYIITAAQEEASGLGATLAARRVRGDAMGDRPRRNVQNWSGCLLHYFDERDRDLCRGSRLPEHRRRYSDGDADLPR